MKSPDLLAGQSQDAFLPKDYLQSFALGPNQILSNTDIAKKPFTLPTNNASEIQLGLSTNIKVENNVLNVASALMWTIDTCILGVLNGSKSILKHCQFGKNSNPLLIHLPDTQRFDAIEITVQPILDGYNTRVGSQRYDNADSNIVVTLNARWKTAEAVKRGLT